jgi:hypothetical protein
LCGFDTALLPPSTTAGDFCEAIEAVSRREDALCVLVYLSTHGWVDRGLHRFAHVACFGRSSAADPPFNGIPTVIFKQTHWDDLSSESSGDAKGDAKETKHTASFLRSEKARAEWNPVLFKLGWLRADRRTDCQAQRSASNRHFGVVKDSGSALWLKCSFCSCRQGSWNPLFGDSSGSYMHISARCASADLLS